MYRFTFSRPRHWLEGSSQLHTSAALHPGKEPPYQLDRSLSGAHSRSRRQGEVKIFIPLY
jgi:hypothetical protein